MKMNFNWKVVVILIVLFGTVVWGIMSFIPLSYSGTDIEFDISRGAVQMTNSSDTSIAVELVGDGVRSFSVSSPNSDIEGKSVREGTGRSSTQSFVFALPPGDSQFTVMGGDDVRVISNSDTSLNASVNLLSTNETRDRLILITVIMLVSLYFLSRINDHRWISASRRRKAQEQADAQEANRETFKRMFGR